MKRQEDYPQEYFIPIENEPFYLGRVTINQIRNTYNSEIDLVLKESKKIFKHIGMFHGFETSTEAIDSSVQKLSKFLSKKQ